MVLGNHVLRNGCSQIPSQVGSDHRPWRKPVSSKSPSPLAETDATARVFWVPELLEENPELGGTQTDTNLREPEKTNKCFQGPKQQKSTKHCHSQWPRIYFKGLTSGGGRLGPVCSNSVTLLSWHPAWLTWSGTVFGCRGSSCSQTRPPPLRNTECPALHRE